MFSTGLWRQKRLRFTERSQWTYLIGCQTRFICKHVLVSRPLPLLSVLLSYFQALGTGSQEPVCSATASWPLVTDSDGTVRPVKLLHISLFPTSVNQPDMDI